MKNSLFIIVCALCFIFSCTDSETQNMKDLSRVAEEINEKCPRLLDSETRFDGIEVKEPNTLVYRYTLVKLDAQNMDTARFYRAMWPGIISTVKISPEMKKLRENNTNIEYSYQDKNGKDVYRFKITPADYN
jgi:hypothetical protein